MQKCNRLADYGSEHELPTVYKTAALQQMLTGESKRLFELWKLEGLTFEKIMAKLKEYARGHTLDGEANRGKQAVGMNLVHDEQSRTKEGEEEEEGGTVNKIGQLRCKHCKKFGHRADQCPKMKGAGGTKGEEGKGKSKGSEGGGGKGKGKKGPKGGCYNCGGDHYASDCPKTGKGGVKVLTLCPVSEIPLHNRYEELKDEEHEGSPQGEGSSSARTHGPGTLDCTQRTSLKNEPKTDQLHF